MNPLITRILFVAALLGSVVLPLTSRAQTNTTPAVETLTLEEAYDRTLETDQTIRIAYEEIQKQNLSTWSALTRISPRLSAGGSYTKPQENISIPGIGPLNVEEKSANFTVMQPIIDLTVFPAYREGKLSKQSANLAHQFTVRTVLFGVASEYYDVLKQQRLVTIDRTTLDLANQQLDLAQKRFNVGEVTKTDVLRARVTMERALRALTESENSLRLSHTVLGNILNYGGERDFILAEPPGYSSTIDSLENMESLAAQKREDLQIANLTIQQDIAHHHEVAFQYGPLVSAQWSNIWTDPATIEQPSSFWYAGVSIGIPIFEGGQREVDLKRTNHETEQARQTRDILVKTVEVDVKNAWLQVKTLDQTLQALKAEMDAAEESYKNIQDQYKAGTATSLDVFSALDDLNSARTDLATETYDYQVAMRNLDRAVGTFQEDRVKKLGTNK